jgi:hypothetical protein
LLYNFILKSETNILIQNQTCLMKNHSGISCPSILFFRFSFDLDQHLHYTGVSKVDVFFKSNAASYNFRYLHKYWNVEINGILLLQSNKR